jgi:hypothetical protein
MPAKECPTCGKTMRHRERDVVDRLPGTPQTRTTRSCEWVCPECDYFEEAEE